MDNIDDLKSVLARVRASRQKIRSNTLLSFKDIDLIEAALKQQIKEQSK